jgi:hypothetical protein
LSCARAGESGRVGDLWRAYRNNRAGSERFNSRRPDGKRKSIRLGKVSEWTAEGVKLHVEALVIAAVAGHPVDGGTARWVAKLETVMHDKLSAVGLVPKRESAALGEFITSYVESRTDLKESSRIVCRTVQSRMLAYFPAGTKLQDVTPRRRG